MAFSEVTCMDSLQRSFLPCYSSVTLYNEWSIARNEVYWPLHFSVCDWLLRNHVLQLSSGYSPILSILTGFKQRSFLHVCNAV